LCAALLLPLAATGPVASQGAGRQDEAGSAPGAQDADLAHQVFTVRYRSIDEVYLLVSPLLGPGGTIQTQPHQRTLSVTETPATLLRIAEVIAAYDVPPRSVEVSVQLILASIGQGSRDAPPPPPIRGVIDRLSALSTRWQDYRLLGDARVMGTEGESSAVQVGDSYRVAFRIDRVSDENRVIRFKPFELQRREPAVEGMERYSSIMNTVLNLRDSQLFIVGASKMERSNRALFMTVTAALQPPRP
jgi:hypothetical protein